MATYIALLRGINVGGKNKLSSEGLMRLFSSLGFTGVRTYIQSGNVVFDSPKAGADGLAERISSEIKGVLALDVPVLVRSAEELARIIDRNPFLPHEAHHADKLHVTFLSRSPDGRAVEKMSMPKKEGEDFRLIGSEIFLFCPNGYGRTRLTNTTFEKTLGVRATTRNWATVTRLLELARE